MAGMIVTSKTLKSMGSKINETQGSQVSSFARRQMEKYGWTEGKGLGKNESGIKKHVKITKREDNTGIGSDRYEVEQNEDSENWWHKSYANALKKVSKPKKRKLKEAAEVSEERENGPSFEELFAATGGARLGMRARGSQQGKLQRTEGDAGEGQRAEADQEEKEAVAAVSTAAGEQQAEAEQRKGKSEEQKKRKTKKKERKVEEEEKPEDRKEKKRKRKE